MNSNPSWQIDPTTGDYVLDSAGKPVSSSDLKTPAYFRLAIQRTKWLYAPNSNYGSDFYLMKKRHASSDANLSQTIAERALQPMIDDGRASSVAVTVVEQPRNGVSLAIQIVDNQGEPSVLPLDQIGV